MKTPEEYLNFIEFAEVDASEAGMFYFADNLEKGELIKLIQQTQVDAWNEALDMAAESAAVKAYYKNRYKGSRYKEWQEGDDIDLFDTTQMYKVDKQSILKLKI
jgi:tripartite-type tricarboxylate transporter receptor subunit TctC